MAAALQHTTQAAALARRTAALPPTTAAAARPAARWLPSRWLPSRRPDRRGARIITAAAADGDSEVAVFRFTLGNDALDAQVPRIVGSVGAALLVLNHVFGSADPSEAQVRAEALGAALAAVAIATPTIEQRLKELQPGRGRQAAASSVEGAASVFALQPGLPEATAQELAWASYALLKNANICGLAVFWDGEAVLARGLLGAAALGSGSGSGSGAAAAGGKGKSDAAAVLAALSSGEQAAASKQWQQGPVYCADRAAIGKAGAGSWPCVPAGAESLLLQPLLPFGSDGSVAAAAAGSGASRGLMLLLSERPRALSSKERAWAAAVAAKLHSALGSNSGSN